MEGRRHPHFLHCVCPNGTLKTHIWGRFMLQQWGFRCQIVGRIDFVYDSVCHRISRLSFPSSSSESSCWVVCTRRCALFFELSSSLADLLPSVPSAVFFPCKSSHVSSCCFGVFLSFVPIFVHHHTVATLPVIATIDIQMKLVVTMRSNKFMLLEMGQLTTCT